MNKKYSNSVILCTTLLFAAPVIAADDMSTRKNNPGNQGVIDKSLFMSEKRMKQQQALRSKFRKPASAAARARAEKSADATKWTPAAPEKKDADRD